MRCETSPVTCRPNNKTTTINLKLTTSEPVHVLRGLGGVELRMKITLVFFHGVDVSHIGDRTRSIRIIPGTEIHIILRDLGGAVI